MAVGLKAVTELRPVPGIRLGTVAAGIRKPGRRDLVVIDVAPGARAAAVFTRNRFCAAPVLVAREHLGQASPRALLINTGYANAGTGEAGRQDALTCCRVLAQALGCDTTEVLPFSTGVIGERLAVERLVAAVPRCLDELRADGWVGAAHGIMTTDTVAKGCSQVTEIEGRTVTVTGIAKGAGMIRPDMATMLAFLGTDADVEPAVLSACLTAAVERSFNRISVDGDTSTNDACVLIATGKAGHAPIAQHQGAAYDALLAAVTRVCTTLAQAIVRDGEGATKFITIHVAQGRSEDDCRQVAYTIAHSPLVKTAFFASDPNWGRILAAVGRAPVADLAVEAVSIYLDDVCVVRKGGLAPDYTEARGREVMQRPEITVRVELDQGRAEAEVWTCDLSHDYVRINAEYRT